MIVLTLPPNKDDVSSYMIMEAAVENKGISKRCEYVQTLLMKEKNGFKD